MLQQSHRNRAKTTAWASPSCEKLLLPLLPPDDDKVPILPFLTYTMRSLGCNTMHCQAMSNTGTMLHRVTALELVIALSYCCRHSEYYRYYYHPWSWRQHEVVAAAAALVNTWCLVRIRFGHIN
jgi:hypothetical protein